MAKKADKKKLEKTYGTFEIVGRVKLGKDHYVDTQSDSGYIYRKVNFSIDTGNGNKPYVIAMGGFNPTNPMPIKMWDKGVQTEIDWSDRHNPAVLKKIPNYKFHKVALEKDDADNLVYKEFLHMYDALEEIGDKLHDGMVVKVVGDLKYQDYKDNVSVQKEIKNIYLSEEPEEKFHATFKQGIVTTKDGFDESELKKTGEIHLTAVVFDYEKEAEGNRPFRFNYVIDIKNFKSADGFKTLRNILKPTDSNSTIYVEIVGKIKESRNVRKATLDDYDEETRLLIEGGLMEEEDLLNVNVVEGEGEKVVRWDITNLQIKEDKETKKRSYVRVIDKYSMDDLVYASKSQEYDLNNDLDEIDLGDLDDLDGLTDDEPVF